MRQALLILAKSMILGAGSSVLFALGLHLVISEHWALDRIGRNHVDTWITVAIVWFFTLVTWFIVSRLRQHQPSHKVAQVVSQDEQP